MHDKLFSYSLFLCLLLASFKSAGQSVVATAGNYSQTAAGSVHWTVGEPLIQTYEAPGEILTQGVHQPILMEVTSASQPRLIELGIEVFPNPVSRAFVVRHQNAGPLTGILSGPAGQAIFQRVFEAGDTSVDISTLPAGHYTFSVYEGKKSMGSIIVLKP